MRTTNRVSHAHPQEATHDTHNDEHRTGSEHDLRYHPRAAGFDPAAADRGPGDPGAAAHPVGDAAASGASGRAVCGQRRRCRCPHHRRDRQDRDEGHRAELRLKPIAGAAGAPGARGRDNQHLRDRRHRRRTHGTAAPACRGDPALPRDRAIDDRSGLARVRGQRDDPVVGLPGRARRAAHHDHRVRAVARGARRARGVCAAALGLDGEQPHRMDDRYRSREQRRHGPGVLALAPDRDQAGDRQARPRGRARAQRARRLPPLRHARLGRSGHHAALSGRGRPGLGLLHVRCRRADHRRAAGPRPDRSHPARDHHCD